MELNFEQALQKLENIVEQLEKGQLNLEDSLKYFEDGVQLSRQCEKQLQDAEKKIEILLKNKEGNLQVENFNLGSGSSLSKDSKEK